jgi:hypothetical protein
MKHPGEDSVDTTSSYVISGESAKATPEWARAAAQRPRISSAGNARVRPGEQRVLRKRRLVRHVVVSRRERYTNVVARSSPRGCGVRPRGHTARDAWLGRVVVVQGRADLPLNSVAASRQVFRGEREAGPGECNAYECAARGMSLFSREVNPPLHNVAAGRLDSVHGERIAGPGNV